jgi:ABC-type amino acid transport substrate-binding protein
MARIAALALTVLALAACERFPRDSAGALDRIEREMVVRVGVVEHAPWVTVAGGRPGGLEPQLIEAWAAQRGARVAYVQGSLEDMAEALHRREVDILAAGLDRKTPFKKQVELTQGYLTLKERGKKKAHALGVTQGESALLLSLDRFLKAQDEAALKQRLPGAGA